MLVVGLTGGVGMGKTMVAEYLRSLGEAVIDTDVLAREVVARGSDALKEIRAEFGSEVFTGSGELDRAALARVVFEHEDRRKCLEGMLHPRIRGKWRRAVEDLRREGKSRAIVIIPLLFETEAEKEVQRTVCVGCSRRVQMTRLRERGWTQDEAQRRVGAQWPIERKMELADAVIWNETSIEISHEQAARVFARQDFGTAS